MKLVLGEILGQVHNMTGPMNTEKLTTVTKCAHKLSS